MRVSGKSVATKFKKDSAFQINLEMYLKRTTSNYAAVNLGTLMGLVKMKVCLKTSAPKFLWAENKSDKLKNLGRSDCKVVVPSSQSFFCGTYLWMSPLTAFVKSIA